MMNERMNEQALRDIVQQRVDERWSAWASAHPNLAAAIDRVELTELTVGRVRRDPAYRRAMEAAAMDEAQLATARRVLRRIDDLVERVLG